jgi:uncharacterized protein YdcH (DUF465 family)
MMTRKALADAIDSLDDDIKVLQESKAETYAAYRDQMKGQGAGKDAVKLEMVAVKTAIRQRRALTADATGVEERDSLTDEILTEIRSGTDRATRAHVARDQHAA